MSRLLLIALTFATVAAGTAGVARAEENDGGLKDQLVIVDRNAGRVIYDDGRNDLFCVTQRHWVGYNRYGTPVYRRSMNCR